MTLLLAVAGGVLTETAFPGLDWWPAAVGGIAVLFLALGRDSARWNALVGLAFGLAFFGPHLTWADEAVGWVPWVALTVAEALMIALFGAAWTWLRRARPVWHSTTAQVLAFPVLWVAVEELRSAWPFGGFPWGRLAFSQADSPLARVAWLGGVPLLSAVTCLAGVLLALSVRNLLRVHLGVASGQVLLVAAILGATFLVPLDTQAEAGALNVGAVQGNVPEPGLNAFAERRRVLLNHVEGTHALLERVQQGELDVVLWPENGSDIDPQVDAEAAAVIDDAALAVGAPILVGTIEYPPTGGRLNTLLLWQPEGQVLDRYSKQHPAPFAEYIPLRDLARRFSSAVDLVQTDMIGGTEVGLIELPSERLGRTVGLATVICFEVAYDALVRDGVRAGGELIVVPTNNSNFGYSDEATQQLAMSRIRAIEHGRATVQISTVGVSALISPDGTVRQQTGLFTAEQLVGRLPLRTSTTPATAAGPWISWGFAAAGALAVALGLVARVPRRERVA